MKCIVLAAGYATRLYPLTENFPKPLLKVDKKSILDWLLQDIDDIECIDSHIVVSNHKFFGHFQSWREECRLKKPVTVLDDGSTDNGNRLGAVRDVQYAIEQMNINDDILVIAGDNVVDFSLKAFTDFAEVKGTTCIMCYQEMNNDVLKKCGVIEPDSAFKVIRMLEKPQNPPSNWAVPPFYVYTKTDLPYVKAGIEQGCAVDAPGSFISWLCEQKPVFAMPMPGKRYDIGSLESYEKVQREF